MSVAGIAHGAELDDVEGQALAPHSSLQEEGISTLEDEQKQYNSQQDGRNE